MFYATGKKKCAIARLYLRFGVGVIFVNSSKFTKIFMCYSNNKLIRLAEILNLHTKFNLFIKVSGGGLSSQVNAVLHAFAKAVLKYDNNLKSVLRDYGLLTRDSRIVERKKVGLRKARKAVQYSKR